MAAKTAARRAEGKGGEPGQKSVTVNQNNTTAWFLRQFLKIALPWIAAAITSTRFTDRKSRFLDRLIVLAERGDDDKRA